MLIGPLTLPPICATMPSAAHSPESVVICMRAVVTVKARLETRDETRRAGPGAAKGSQRLLRTMGASGDGAEQSDRLPLEGECREGRLGSINRSLSLSLSPELFSSLRHQSGICPSTIRSVAAPAQNIATSSECCTGRGGQRRTRSH
ncbi:hypothetical protein BAUCODRAFT_437344 [Baudoinia panamericana UAMH 10762]|uniref:Uncharacterized protein n=1 Tax=Baudoinia panamericana (strain UAMH 10762) TaxID=717646 RepID=M2MK61_BAUPA|nr:uncharacterized protein BAUCODRAFT_437344 [Baudoinia panamericana UAMH 10762]EMC97076.1 hypothetical protein BAUCODRAFT_437344 [Baudoinia panamericana UAMH 10762]